MELTDLGKDVATVEVRIGPQFLNLFSEHLYSSPNKAFEELVSNSWDAGASHVFIHTPDDPAAEGAALWVLDDGGSMDIEGFTALWSVATSSKRQSEGANARRPIGKFGVGKLATYLLAHELTYVCKAADGVIRAITMDYRRIDAGEKGALHIDPLPLQVREISPSELANLLATVPGRDRILDLITGNMKGASRTGDFEDEFGGSDEPPPPPSGTWTLAVLSSLKDQGKRLSAGWVRRLLRASLPLGRSIEIYFNDELLTSAKAKVEVANEWVLGPGLGLGPLKIGDDEIEIVERTTPFQHLYIEGIGEVSGRVRLYADKISGGRSEEIELSNGFFVNIRGRVIKPDDPYFGLDNLSHSVWARFRATVRADGLDGFLAVNREAVSDGPQLRIFRALLMRLFNKARSDYDATTADSWPDVGSVLTEKWGNLPFEPLRRVVDEGIDGAGELPPFVVLPTSADRTTTGADWKKAVRENPGDMITDVKVQELGSSSHLSLYDLETRSVIINRNHPFAVEHQETSQQLRVLRDTALVELLTDAFMVDIGLSPDQIMEIRTYRDRAFRLVAQVRRRSASQIAGLLLDATNHVKGFERIIGDALEHIGFDVQRLGASGEPEGVATAIVSRGELDAHVAYKFTYDAKSAQKGKVQTGNVGTAGLARHREDYEAQHSLVIGPMFQGGVALQQECELTEVTPMLAQDLARLVMLSVGYGPLNLVTFREVLKKRSPADVSEWIDQLAESQKQAKHLSLGILIQALKALGTKNPERPDMLSCSLIAEQCRELLNKNDFPQRGDVANAVRGLALMAPNVISITGNDVMLSAPPNKIGELIASQINSIPDPYRYGMARGVTS